MKPACNQLYEEFEVAAAGNFYEALTAAAGLDRDTALYKTWNSDSDLQGRLSHEESP